MVLSGCHSAAGATLRGSGLLGLTRAWLTAGARSVVASRWSTPDENGVLFQAFYSDLRTHNREGAAASLRAAQLECLSHSACPAALLGRLLCDRKRMTPAPKAQVPERPSAAGNDLGDLVRDRPSPASDAAEHEGIALTP